MFEQVVGSGANTFLIILAVLIGFIGALAYTDSVRYKKDAETKKRGD
jgi:Na+-transporting methylmalonyl-CoA/oxaloacetate decarboxylase gamma subunit